MTTTLAPKNCYTTHFKADGEICNSMCNADLRNGLVVI